MCGVPEPLDPSKETSPILSHQWKRSVSWYWCFGLIFKEKMHFIVSSCVFLTRWSRCRNLSVTPFLPSYTLHIRSAHLGPGSGCFWLLSVLSQALNFSAPLIQAQGLLLLYPALWHSWGTLSPPLTKQESQHSSDHMAQPQQHQKWMNVNLHKNTPTPNCVPLATSGSEPVTRENARSSPLLSQHLRGRWRGITMSSKPAWATSLVLW